MDNTIHPIKRNEIAGWLARRPLDCHKGDFGDVAVLGGAPGMSGAALLAGRAALRLGAGRVYCGLLDDRVAVDFKAPELMLSSPEQALAVTAPGCLVAGPGLGRSSSAMGWLEAALAVELPLLLDADALNLIATETGLADRLRNRVSPTLLTPHPGEAGRLLKASASEVQGDRPGAIRKLAEDYRCGVVLKGSGSLIHFPGGELWRNDSGHPGMAAPGMGDVLAGMVAALAGQGLTLAQAAVFGVHLHGAAGDQAVRDGIGPVGLTAGELPAIARRLLNDWVYGMP